MIYYTVFIRNSVAFVAVTDGENTSHYEAAVDSHWEDEKSANKRADEYNRED